MQDLRKRCFLLVDLYLAALDAAHIQHIIDQAEQMIAGGRDLRQIILHLFRIVDVRRGKRSKAYDRIHRRPDIMGHVIEECRLRPVGMLCRCQCVLQVDFLPLQLLLHFFLVINIHKKSHKGDGRTVFASGKPAGGMEAPPSGVFCEQMVFHIIGLLSGIIPDGVPVFSDHPLPVLVMQQIRP